jgi:hypothetical protein
MAIDEIEAHLNHYIAVLIAPGNTQKGIKEGEFSAASVQAFAEHLHLSVGILTGDNRLFLANAELSPFRYVL